MWHAVFRDLQICVKWLVEAYSTEMVESIGRNKGNWKMSTYIYDEGLKYIYNGLVHFII